MDSIISVPGVDSRLELDRPVRLRKLLALKGLPPKVRKLARAIQSWFPFEGSRSRSLQMVLDDAFERSNRNPLLDLINGLRSVPNLFRKK